MQKKLILLCETERAMLVEALTHFLENKFIGTDCLISLQNQNLRENGFHMLSLIKNLKGGFRVECSEADLEMCAAGLKWYGNFFPRFGSNKSFNTYTTLGVNVLERDKYAHIFNFDPANYDPLQEEPIIKKDFSQDRILIARTNQDTVEHLTEFPQKDNEPLSHYQERAQKALKSYESYSGHYRIIFNTELSEMKISDECSYFHSGSD